MKDPLIKLVDLAPNLKNMSKSIIHYDSKVNIPFRLSEPINIPSAENLTEQKILQGDSLLTDQQQLKDDIET